MTAPADTTVTVYVDNRIDGQRTMTAGQIAAGYWTSPYADPDQYPWPRSRSFGVFLASSPTDGGLGVTIDPDGIRQDDLLDVVLDLRPQPGGDMPTPGR